MSSNTWQTRFDEVAPVDHKARKIPLRERLFREITICTDRRIRVKDAVNCIWWLSPSPWPKSSNRRVAVPNSESMKHLLKSGYRANVVRPSGHDISEKFSRDQADGGQTRPQSIGKSLKNRAESADRESR